MSRTTTAGPCGPFTIVRDFRGNFYIIPSSKVLHWKQEYVPVSGEIPEYARYIGQDITEEVEFQEWRFRD